LVSTVAKAFEARATAVTVVRAERRIGKNSGKERKEGERNTFRLSDAVRE
jgi:hypothetical protein